MENTSNNSQEPSIEKAQFDLPIFVSRTLQAGFALLVFGGIFIILIKFNVATDIIAHPIDPMSFLGGAIVLVALTLLGVPLIPAATAGVATWWVIQDLFGKLN
ncbi:MULTISPECIES: hypothetical protein [Leptolyngbya]|uniref:hypothetical protein n=1 Tax=Leptolyngbya TaxID=47251 RepID=UPI0016847618|nr:hypothetical protein [Leptolyngbya sp. FACHB-1624]MBD1858008.1 hypothetical protein [Leptolyngbya sp. FACHB-1624]